MNNSYDHIGVRHPVFVSGYMAYDFDFHHKTCLLYSTLSNVKVRTIISYPSCTDTMLFVKQVTEKSYWRIKNQVANSVETNGQIVQNENPRSE